VEAPPVFIIWPLTQLAPLEKLPYGPNAGHTGQDHDGQTQKTNQTANIENVRHVLNAPMRASWIQLISERPETHAHTPRTSCHKS